MTHRRLSTLFVISLLAAACDRSTLPPTKAPAIPEAPAAPGADDIATPDIAAPTAEPQASFVPGPGGFPLPTDAAEKQIGGVVAYEVPRGRVAVGDEIKALLAADGWTIDSEEVSPRFAALRLKVSKDGQHVDARVAGDDAKAAIIVTVKTTS